MIDRLIEHRLISSKKSTLLLGPRQVGKSTLIQSLKPNLYINLADEEIFLDYSKDAGRLKRRIAALPKKELIVIDEVQRVPSLLNSVQAILDISKDLRFILTGSSARKLKRGGANLLPGRIILEYLDPLSFWELQKSFDLERVLKLGSLPGIYLDLDSGSEVLGTYATVYLKEEIQAEAATKNVGDYARFLDVAAEASGQWMNYSKIANDTEIPKETIRRFFTLLEDTLIVHRVPSFRPKQTKRRVSQRDRFVFFDMGVRNSLLKIHKGVLSPIEKGVLFEQWIFLQCLTFIRSHKKEWTISSYRTDGGAEVDWIIDTGGIYLAIECKWGSQVSETDTRGLRSFEAIAKKKVKKYIVYRGSHREKMSQGELVLPFEDFLGDILPNS